MKSNVFFLDEELEEEFKKVSITFKDDKLIKILNDNKNEVINIINIFEKQKKDIFVAFLVGYIIAKWEKS